jgi:ATP-dependent RNA helicase DDX18/HAS1
MGTLALLLALALALQASSSSALALLASYPSAVSLRAASSRPSSSAVRPLAAYGDGPGRSKGGRAFRSWDEDDVLPRPRRRKGRPGGDVLPAPVSDALDALDSQARGGQRAAKPMHAQLDAAGTEDSEYFFSAKTMQEIGTSAEAVEAAKGVGMTRPSKIQAASYRTVLEGGHCAIMDQTGSGKTLAYLLPLMQMLRDEETAAGGKRLTQPKCPRLLILAPTSELAQQVHSVAKNLSSVLRMRVVCITGGSGRGLKSQVKLLEEGIDVLVATPGRVSTLLEEGSLSLEGCKSIVLDEVDVLFLDDTFKLAPIGTGAPEDAQFVFVTATFPREVAEMVKSEFPGVKFVTGPGLHRVAAGVEQVLVDCSGPEDEPKTPETGLKHKRDALIAALEQRKTARTLVFCNTIRSCREVENLLQRYDRASSRIQALPYHGALDSKVASKNLQQFSKTNALLPMVLICTDRSSRGMDFDRAEVGHVVLFDFPRDPIEYMRRVGRTARAGRKGVVTVLAFGWQVPLARDIMAGVRQGRRLVEVDD